MKQFNGRIQRLNVLNGKLEKKLHGLKIHILPISTHPKAEIRPHTPYRATVDKVFSFGGMVKRLNVLFRFLWVEDKLTIIRKSKAISAPAVDIEIDSNIQAIMEAPASAHPAKEIAVHNKTRFSVSAKLQAYIRAGCRYAKKLFFKSTANLDTAPGTATKYSEILELHRTSKAISADSAIIESRFNKTPHKVKAAVGSAPVQYVPDIESTFATEHNAMASKGTAVTVGINDLFRAVHHAPLASWFLPERDGDTLRFHQVFSGVQSGNVLEVDLEAESAYWANAKVTDGTLNLVFAETATKNNTILEVV